MYYVCVCVMSTKNGMECKHTTSRCPFAAASHAQHRPRASLASLSAPSAISLSTVERSPAAAAARRGFEVGDRAILEKR